MSWVAVAIGGSAVVGAASSAIGSSKAAKASQQATDATTAESQRQFDLVRADTAPQRELGIQAVDKLKALLGGDYSAVRNDPGYQFNLEQGQKAIDNSLIARGQGLSGQAVKEGIRFGTGLADSTTNSIYQRYAQIAGLGAQGINTSAAAGSNTASLVGNANANNAAQRGSSYMTGAAGINSAVQGGISNYLLNQYLRPSSTVTGTGYNR